MSRLHGIRISISTNLAASLEFKMNLIMQIPFNSFTAFLLFQTDQSSDILQHSQNRLIGNRWLKL